MEPVERTNKDCPLINTRLCEYVGSEGCSACYIWQAKKSDADGFDEAWDVTLSLLPENIDDLHMADKCWFCREDPEKAEMFAVVDLAHPEPEHKKGMFFGFGKKVRTPVGSLIQLPIGICKKCRRRFLMRDVIRWSLPVLFMIIAAVVIACVPVLSAPPEEQWYIPVIVFLAGLGIGFVIGQIIGRIYDKKIEKDMHVEVFELPIVSKMQWDGWFAMMADKGKTRLSFVKQKPKPHMLYKREAYEERLRNGEVGSAMERHADIN